MGWCYNFLLICTELLALNSEVLVASDNAMSGIDTIKSIGIGGTVTVTAYPTTD